jgi:IPT/TIG domain/S-layer homology domain
VNLRAALATIGLSLCAACFVSSSVYAQSAVVASPVPNPVFVNLYWDANWDADNPAFTIHMIDTFTSAIVNSSYFGGLAEYYSPPKPPRATFYGSFRSAPGFCGSDSNGLPPTTIGVYDLFGGTTLGSFVDCAASFIATVGTPNVIYNLFLPPMTTPYKISKGDTCTPGGGVGFHAASGLTAHGNIFTVNPTNPACLSYMSTNPFGAVTSTLTHEMVEATTDPYISLSMITNQNEIGDLCSSNAQNTPFLPIDGPAAGGLAQNYFSNSSSACVAGFTDLTAPTIASVSSTNWGASMTISISGSGFGNFPSTLTIPIYEPSGVPTPGPAITLPQLIDLPYVLVQDTSASPRWEAGNSLNADGAEVLYSSWSDQQILISGFGGSAPLPNDSLIFTACNPASGQCTRAELIVPTAPRVSSVTPSGGPPQGGTPITITGSGFNTSLPASVAMGNRTVSATVSSSTQVTATTPPGQVGSTTAVQVLNGSMPSLPGFFSYCGPTVTGVQPNSGQKGTNVQVSGSCFTGAASVTFGIAGAGTSVTVHSDTQITVEAPQLNTISCGTVDIQVNWVDSLHRVIYSSPITPRDHFSYGGNSKLCPTQIGNGDPCLAPHAPPICTMVCLRTNPPQWCTRVGVRTPLVPLGFPISGLSDISGYPRASAAIHALVRQGILVQDSPGRFAPERPVSRAEFALAFVRAFTYSKPVQSPAFSDIPAGAPNTQAYAQVQPYLFHYASGDGTLLFHPEFPVQRDEAAVAGTAMLVAARKLTLLSRTKDIEVILGRVKDRNQIPEGMRAATATAMKAGLVTAGETGDLRPLDFLTRADLALLMYRFESFFPARPARHLHRQRPN